MIRFLVDENSDSFKIAMKARLAGERACAAVFVTKFAAVRGALEYQLIWQTGESYGDTVNGS